MFFGSLNVSNFESKTKCLQKRLELREKQSPKQFRWPTRRPATETKQFRWQTAKPVAVTEQIRRLAK